MISRKLLDPGEPAYHQVVEHFGDQILYADGRVNRAALRQIVFSEKKHKSWLETMLHPLIYQHSHAEIVRLSRSTYVLVVVPLLFETNFQSLVDRILVVDCPAEQQIRRLMNRDGIDETLARNMPEQQMSNAQRVARAHDIINNRDDEVDLAAQVESLHQKYLAMAADR